MNSDLGQNEWVNQLLSISPRWLPMHTWKESLYSYPKASTEILTNIVRCMKAVPNFYIQGSEFANPNHLHWQIQAWRSHCILIDQHLY
nr:unnamed protein product [Spirometra erinaceieuropaei]